MKLKNNNIIDSLLTENPYSDLPPIVYDRIAWTVLHNASHHAIFKVEPYIEWAIEIPDSPLPKFNNLHYCCLKPTNH